MRCADINYYYCYSPNAKKIISPADRELLEQHGAAVVECSWVRVQEVPWSRIGGKCERLRTLPSCILVHTMYPNSNNIIIYSTLPHRSKHSQLRQTLAPKLRRSTRRLFLHLRARRLGQGDPQTLPLRRRVYRNQREAPKAVRCLRDGGRRQED